MKILVLDDSPQRHAWFQQKYPGCVTEAHSADAAIDLLQLRQFDHIFLDHDLGEGDPTGYAVAKWMAEHKPPARQVWIHSMNPVGAKNMEQALRAAGYHVSCTPFFMLRP